MLGQAPLARAETSAGSGLHELHAVALLIGDRGDGFAAHTERHNLERFRRAGFGGGELYELLGVNAECNAALGGLLLLEAEDPGVVFPRFVQIVHVETRSGYAGHRRRLT